jgi:hypothetical protein
MLYIGFERGGRIMRVEGWGVPGEACRHSRTFRLIRFWSAISKNTRLFTQCHSIKSNPVSKREL